MASGAFYKHRHTVADQSVAELAVRLARPSLFSPKQGRARLIGHVAMTTPIASMTFGLAGSNRD